MEEKLQSLEKQLQDMEMETQQNPVKPPTLVKQGPSVVDVPKTE